MKKEQFDFRQWFEDEISDLEDDSEYESICERLEEDLKEASTEPKQPLLRLTP